MSFTIDKPFDLEKIRLEELSKIIARALTHFEDNPGICWTQMPIEKPLWEALKESVEKQVPKKPSEQQLNINKDLIGLCPTCKEMWVIKYKGYCANCGQKLDWD